MASNNINESWDGFSGQEVETYIREQLGSKVGYLSVFSVEDTHYLCYFASEEDYNTWTADTPTLDSEYLLGYDILPAGGGSGTAEDRYMVSLLRDSNQPVIGAKAEIGLCFKSSIMLAIGGQEDTNEAGVLTLQYRKGSDPWSEAKAIGTLVSIGMNDSPVYKSFDLTNELPRIGEITVRITVLGEESNKTARLTFTANVTKLYLENVTEWQYPIRPQGGTVNLKYQIEGAVNKRLNWSIVTGNISLLKEPITIGTSTYTKDNPYNLAVRDASVTGSHGVKTVRAWLSVVGGSTDILTTAPITTQFMVVTDTSNSTPYFIVNNKAPQLTNWVDQTLFDYAVYTNDGEPLPVVIEITDLSGSTIYQSLPLEVPSQTKLSFQSNLGIDVEEGTPAFSIKVTVYRGLKDLEGNIIKDTHSVLASNIEFEVDNSINFAPTPGANLIISPNSNFNGSQQGLIVNDGVDGDTVLATWENFLFISDGWTTDSSNNRCLRVPAHRQVIIDYNAFSDFMGGSAVAKRGNVTIEFDFATRNITDYNTPVVLMCSYQAQDDGTAPIGFEIKPTQACFTNTSNLVVQDLDVMFQEDTRTHMALNVIYTGEDRGYARIFINGVLNREFVWNSDNTFIIDNDATNIKIGSEGCDIDIYGIRVYKNNLSAKDVRQDYLASIPTSEAKIAFREANDIIGDTSTIELDLVAEKGYNYILIDAAEGIIPSYLTPAEIDGDIRIHINGEPECSGTINNVHIKGQGTSSKTYWKWNLQFGFNSDSIWIDETGENRGNSYKISADAQKASKLVLKINWASSPNSHKMGSVNLFTDLWRTIVGGNSITSIPGKESTRVSVEQKPVFLFVRNSSVENSQPVFYGLGTFGPGKGDKKTFGYYDKTVQTWYLMLEGCDNGEPLVNHRIPWNQDVQITEIMEGDNPTEVKDVLVYYNGKKQWELTLGKKAASNKSFPRFQEIFNFLYKCNPHLEPFDGTSIQIKNNSLDKVKVLNKNHLYWITQGDDKYHMFRYDILTESWVDGGINKLGEGQYEVFDVLTEAGLTTNSVYGQGVTEATATIILARVNKFKNEFTKYFFKTDALFHKNFCKLIAATDNRAKNTYLYLDPDASEENEANRYKIRFAQDDLDTIFLTDNVGKKNKPYYVEEHDTNASGQYYWNGSENALYDLIEMAYADDLRINMKAILTTMVSFAPSADKTVFGCFDKYYFSTQRYFPAVAYNETARLFYEEANAAMQENRYSNNTKPITQSLGDQLQGEMQWVKDRIDYISSYCQFGNYDVNGQGSLLFRSIQNSLGSNPTYNFLLTPVKWMYPVVGTGSSLSVGERMRAGELASFTVGSDGNTNIYIYGIDNYSSIGDFTNHPVGDTFTVSGKRLSEFIVNKAQNRTVEFRPNSVDVTAENITKIVVNGASNVGGELKCPNQRKLKEVDVRGTNMTSVNIAYPELVTSLKLPASIQVLNLTNYVSLLPNNLTFEGRNNIREITIRNCQFSDNPMSLLLPILQANAPISTLIVDKPVYYGPIYNSQGQQISDTSLTAALVAKIAAIPIVNLKGEIHLASIPTLEEQQAMAEKWPDHISANAELRIIYATSPLNSISIKGEGQITTLNGNTFTLIPVPLNANNITAIKWSLQDNEFGEIVGSTTGRYCTVRKSSSNIDSEHREYTLSVSVDSVIDGVTTSLVANIQVWFYAKPIKEGNVVYADGSYGNYTTDKTAIGFVFKVYEYLGDTYALIAPSQADAQQSLALFSSGSGIEFKSPNPDPSVDSVKASANWHYLYSGGVLGDANLHVGNATSNQYLYGTFLERFVETTLIISNYTDSEDYGTSNSSTKRLTLCHGITEFPWSLNYNEDIYTPTLQEILDSNREGTMPLGKILTLAGIYARDRFLNVLEHNWESKLDKYITLMPDSIGSFLYLESVINDGLLLLLYTPPFSYCYHYAPSVPNNTELNPAFKQGKWFLPSPGELLLLISKLSGMVDFNLNDASLPLATEVQKRTTLHYTHSMQVYDSGNKGIGAFSVTHYNEGSESIAALSLNGHYTSYFYTIPITYLKLPNQ